MNIDRYVFVRLDGKKPIDKDWQNTRVSANITELAAKGFNFGVVTGEASGGLVDIDIDDDAALRLAPYFLPETGLLFGRESRPKSHWLYIVNDCESKGFFKVFDKQIEVRGNGHQTMWPGSIHPSGEMVRFDKEGEPARLSWIAARKAAQNLAIATLVSPFWQSGTRHRVALALSGVLRLSGWSENDATNLIEKIAIAHFDNDIEDRIRCVSDTYRSSNTNGFDTLERVTSEVATASLRKLLNVPKTARANNGKALSFSTDLDRAKAFAEANRGGLLYARNQERWFRKINGTYKHLTDVEVMGMISAFAEDTLSGVSDPTPRVAKFKSAAGINAVLTLAKSQLIVDDEIFDQDDQVIGTPSGVLHLGKRELVQHDGLVSKRIGTDFDPSADCPTFKSFIEQTFGKDREVIEFVQRAAGYSLSGSTEEPVIIICVGNGANGKSTLMNIFASVLGEYAGTAPTSMLMDNKYGDKGYELATLSGKRFVLSQETESGSKIAEARVKSILGGEPISVREIYGKPFVYKPKFKLWLATNELPTIHGTDDGIWRRIRVIRFHYTVPENLRDLNLFAKLEAEKAGILNWMLDGYADWRVKRLSAPECVKAETNAYRHESDSVGSFVETCCERIDSSVIPAQTLYSAYCHWCVRCAVDPVAINRFGKNLAKLGYTSVKRSTGNSWRGLRLREEVDPLANL